MSAYFTAATWVRNTLANDSQLAAAVGDRIYEGAAPEKATYPMVTIAAYTDPVDVNYTGDRAMTTVDLIVRVWGSSPSSHGSSLAAIVPLADRVDQLLHKAPAADLPGGSVRSCVRYAEVTSFEERPATFVRAAGGRYRVQVAPAA